MKKICRFLACSILLANLFMSNNICRAETDEDIFKSVKEALKEINLEMADCPAGEFIMGSPESEIGRFGNETQHTVTISKPFSIGKYEVTQAQYEVVMGKNPSEFKDANNPVENVSWNDAKEFCDKLNEKYAEKLPKDYRFDLPTEAQWEYACRAGTSGRFCNGDSDSMLDEVAWHGGNSMGKTHQVGQRKPNAWGIYDMHGNVWEWCRDWYEDYPSGNATDPIGPESGSYRVNRGGFWGSNSGFCRSAARLSIYHDKYSLILGFRLAIVPMQQTK